MVAVSSDPLLLNWEKVTGKAVIPAKNPDGSIPPYRVFDPCIWKRMECTIRFQGGRCRMDPAANGSAPISCSAHRTWQIGSISTRSSRMTCTRWWAMTVPVRTFVPIGDRHILLFFSHMSGGQYLLGDYDKDRDIFVVTAGAKNNFGAAAPAAYTRPPQPPMEREDSSASGI